VIDLHLHTTASDGRSTPDALVAEVQAAGIRIMAVTDHDTVAGIGPASAAARAAGVEFVAGIEITAVHERRDLHMLGYFLDVAHPALGPFLLRQRAERRRRIQVIAERLDHIGAPIDQARLIARADDGTGRSLGRPLVAAALVEAGHAVDIADAFHRYLGEGRPAYVERAGASPAEVVALVRDAGGLSALAHPGKLGRDAIIPDLVAAGLTAIEVFHPDHSPADVRRYDELARRAGLLVTGGSDYHGPGSGRTAGFGQVGLPAEAYDALVAWRRAAG
jgi:predicted metal-dependent phosphoesterase TrpH